MRSLPFIIVAGTNDLALRVCEELCATQGHEVLVMWEGSQELSQRVSRMGAQFEALSPNDYDSLKQVGVHEASCIMPVCDDDRLNLQIALKARDLNPQIRIVLRQFNGALGRKIEQNLPNCTAISPASHAAATFAAAAMDATCIYAVQFPAADGPLIAFSERSASDFGLESATIEQAERKLNARIAAVNGKPGPDPQYSIRSEDRIIVCARVEDLQDARPHRNLHRRGRGKPRARTRIRDNFGAAARTDPLLIYTFAAGAALFFLAAAYFTFALHLSFIQAMYFTASTMLTVGYGDITPYKNGAGSFAMLVAIAVMLVGVALGGLFIATVSSVLNRAQETALHGVRRIRGDGHIVVCGAGNVGTRVIEFLLAMDQRVVVIERRPGTLLMEQARSRRVDLLAADATSDETLKFCGLPFAQALVAITDSDTANLEAALGALAQSPTLPVVMRIADPAFSRSVERNFKLAKSFSASDLTAPAIAGLARSPGSRGRVRLGNEIFHINEQSASQHVQHAQSTIPLFAWREGNLVPLHDFAQVRPEDRVLYVVPLSHFNGT